MTRSAPGIAILAILLCGAAHADGPAAEALLDTRTPLVRLFDTGSPLEGEAVRLDSRNAAGWRRVPEGETPNTFRGDAAISNDRLVAVVRRGTGEVVLFTKSDDAAHPRVVLAPASRGPVSIRVSDRTAGAVELGDQLCPPAVPRRGPGGPGP